MLLIQNAFILSFGNILFPSLQDGISDCKLNIYMYLIRNTFILSFENILFHLYTTMHRWESSRFIWNVLPQGKKMTKRIDRTFKLNNGVQLSSEFDEFVISESKLFAVYNSKFVLSSLW